MSRYRPETTALAKARTLLAMTRRGRAVLAIPVTLGVAATVAATTGGPLGQPGTATARTAFPAAAGQPRLARAYLTAHPGWLPAGRPELSARTGPQVSGSWKRLPAAPVATAPDQAVTVWTGHKMIVYGIRHVSPGTFFQRFNMAYNPGSGTWQQLPRGPQPKNNGEGGDVAVWTGSEMLVLGPTAAAYNPATGTWRPVSPDGPGPTDGAVTGWTGHQVLVWGGVCCEASNSGRAYDVATDTWTAMPASPLRPRAFPAGAWTGRELVVAGGTVRNSDGTFTTFRGGAAYDPAAGSWRRLPLMPRPRSGAQALWDGREVLFLGGFSSPGSAPATRGMAYNPATNSWRLLPAMRFGRDKFTAVWTGRHVLVWGGVSGQAGTALPPHGEAYAPATNTWADLPASPLHGRASPVSVWTGHQMIVWGGDFGSTAYTDGAVFTPSTP